jgi:hypothetical protein
MSEDVLYVNKAKSSLTESKLCCIKSQHHQMLNHSSKWQWT